jgi:glycerol-3-phosphate dehydrogenase
MYDVIIIGAGIIGCSAAYCLSRYQLKVLVVEQGPDVAVATSGANSGIVHGGYDPKPGTLMADLNVWGNALYPQLCKELDVPFRRCGSLVVARAGEEEALRCLLARGRANGVPELAILGRDEILNREPNITSDAAAALYAPSAGIVSPWEMTLALAETAAVNGVQFMFNTRVTGIRVKNDVVQAVETEHGPLSAPVVINAAGIYADKVARLAGVERIDILPRKGEYLLLDKDVDGFVRHVVFPVPTPVSKGILVLPTVEGNVLAGPTATDVQDREDLSTTREGLAAIHRGALGLFPGLPLHKVITSFAGLRAVPADGDFVIRSSAKVRGWIDAGGIQSPGLSAAPAIGERLAGLVGGLAELRPKVQAKRPPVRRLRDLPLADRQEWIHRNPLYGRIICRCEGVSEGEIVAALHRPIPATTLDGLKQRTRAGSGRCQGGFCQPRLIAIIARELGISPLAVTKAGPGSEMLAAYLAKGEGE